MIEWTYSRNQRRHTYTFLDREKDIVFEYQIRATNMENDIDYQKQGFDLYLVKQYDNPTDVIKHTKTVKELKEHLGKLIK